MLVSSSTDRCAAIRAASVSSQDLKNRVAMMRSMSMNRKVQPKPGMMARDIHHERCRDFLRYRRSGAEQTAVISDGCQMLLISFFLFMIKI